MPFDEAAKKAIRTCKDDLCDSILIIDEGAVILTYLESKGYLNKSEAEQVMSAGDGDNSRPRVSKLLTILNAKMTTDLFKQLVELYRDQERGNNPIVADMLEESYEESGGKKSVEETSAAKDIIRGMKNIKIVDDGDTPHVVSGTRILLDGVKTRGPTVIGAQGSVTQVVGGPESEFYASNYSTGWEGSTGNSSVVITGGNIEAEGPLTIGNRGNVRQYMRRGPNERRCDDDRDAFKK